ncbi:hypothetical protein D3C71_1637650 [compost metagenome]
MGGLFADALQALPHPLAGLRVALQALQVALAGVGIVDHCSQRLVDLVGNARSQLAQGGQPGTVRQAFLGFDAQGDVAGHADHLHHRPGIGLADGAAGGLEPEVMPRTVTDAIGHGEVAVLLQSVAGALHQLGHLLRVEQALGELTAQLLRPITEQRPGRG